MCNLDVNVVGLFDTKISFKDNQNCAIQIESFGNVMTIKPTRDRVFIMNG